MPRSARICRSFSFDSAHQLPNHDGKCRHLHGHTYRTEVELWGPVCVEVAHA
jgi:6-pyruvoyltetrahydropterin/6-carboxytetrahydropterin synthase